jgi:hypothetical protein
MRILLVMGIPYQHAPEVSIVRTDTCSCSCSCSCSLLLALARDAPGTEASQSHFKATPKPVGSQPIATHKPPTSHPHASLMRPESQE